MIQSFQLPPKPDALYGSIRYIFGLGGKRLRPVMVLMGADALGQVNHDAEIMALVVESFHNFSLMHDDIMDGADLRRGQDTVHKKWNTATAILGGDALLVKTYQLMDQLQGNCRDQLRGKYSKLALEVCEGQQMDMDFETMDTVSTQEYLEMIRLKTAVLMGAALEFGAMAAQGGEEACTALYHFGVHLGMAFQIKDDYLDCFGDASFGKQTGGDIVQNKKTYLYIKALELGAASELALWVGARSPAAKVAGVKAVFERIGAKREAERTMEQYYRGALQHLQGAGLGNEATEYMAAFAAQVWMRQV